LEFFRDDPDFKVKVLKVMINRDLSLNMKKMILYMTKALFWMKSMGITWSNLEESGIIQIK